MFSFHELFRESGCGLLLLLLLTESAGGREKQPQENEQGGQLVHVRWDQSEKS
jgi:hypothetical protein